VLALQGASNVSGNRSAGEFTQFIWYFHWEKHFGGGGKAQAETPLRRAGGSARCLCTSSRDCEYPVNNIRKLSVVGQEKLRSNGAAVANG
jgi:hypothetical protein